MQWYYIDAQNYVGPVDTHGMKQLKKHGYVHTETYVWSESLSLAALGYLAAIRWCWCCVVAAASTHSAAGGGGEQASGTHSRTGTGSRSSTRSAAARCASQDGLGDVQPSSIAAGRAAATTAAAGNRRRRQPQPVTSHAAPSVAGRAAALSTGTAPRAPGAGGIVQPPSLGLARKHQPSTAQAPAALAPQNLVPPPAAASAGARPAPPPPKPQPPPPQPAASASGRRRRFLSPSRPKAHGTATGIRRSDALPTWR